MISIVAAMVLQAAVGASAPSDRPVQVQPNDPHPNLAVPALPPRNPPTLTQPSGAPGAVRQDTGRPYKPGLPPADYVYTLAPGVTFKEVVFFSDGIACYAKIFYPRGFSTAGKTAAVVLGQGWAGTHHSIEKYGARFAERGLVAMVIDYRGWGSSEGYPYLANQTVGGTIQRDLDRVSTQSAQVEIRRTRLLPKDQQEDYRNAISYIQGEPGVDRDRIGVWGSSYAGGNALAVAGMDSRVKAVSVQIPAVPGSANLAKYNLGGAALEDSIRRARTGRGAEITTGYTRIVHADAETNQATAENNVRAWVQLINRPTQAVLAQFEELSTPVAGVRQALSVIEPKAPLNIIEVPRITHFEMYINIPGVADAFEISSNAAADWFVKYLNAPEAIAPVAGQGGGGRGPAPATAPAPAAAPGRAN